MAHSHVSNLVHCVFSTKNRDDCITDPPRLWHYLGGIAREKNILLLAAGGTSNHLHMLIAVPPAMPLSKAVQEFKGNSSRWLNELTPGFAWQQGYGAFSVSQSQKHVVIQYIDGQEAHHSKWTFEQEFLTLLQKSGMECDSRYVFG